MNKSIFIICTGCLLSTMALAQSVGINNTTPHASAILDIKSSNKGVLLPRTSTSSRNSIASPAKGLLLYDTTTAGFWFNNGTAWTPLSTGSASNYWTLNGYNIFNNNGANVGIGTNSPAYPLTVQTQGGQFGLAHTDGDVTLASYIGTFQGALGGWLGTRSNHPLYFYTNNSAQQVTLAQNGNLGIATINPLAALHIKRDGEAIRLQGAVPYLTFYNNSGTLKGFLQNNVDDIILGTYSGNPNGLLSFYTNGLPKMSLTSGGLLGIGITNPANKLQIGSVGSTTFNGNDLAIGNGTNAMVIYQSNASTLLASSTDIVLMPRNDRHGRVGINTSTPRAPLEVADRVNVVNPYGAGDYTYFKVQHNPESP